MIRVFRCLTILGVCMLLVIPSTILTAIPATAFEEGIHTDFRVGSKYFHYVQIHATKRVDGKWRQSEIYIRYDYGSPTGYRHIDATAILEGDADLLEVSSDLGWGGLDGVIRVQQRRADCTFDSNGNHVCSPEITETISVEIHWDLWANASYQESGDLFTRNARVEGSVKIADQLFEFSPTTRFQASGYNFSDQYPG
jgi:hypothetical protein